ncbi:uncharacterized protein FA14DRAFT_159236 [Meira miltonrushii]|uniref:Ribosomal protein S8 n=1 Tax=Meira miltonrushii TaxID=1280837 RepID=A0A316VKU9_9BASI|nr:uncharacterized protein FA14DRAFT_159236 [Meira miltonrushii]PWN36983.1 hypothetical protein FA14DRAFT_159236 [Meira miltonrushii]
MGVHGLLNIIQNGARARLRSVPLPYTNASIGIATILLNHGFIHSFTRGTRGGPSPSNFLQANIGAKRLWIDLKYGNDDRAVLAHAKTISKPSRKINLNCAELLRLVTGRRAQFISPLGLGEIAIVRCEVKEGKEAENLSPIIQEVAESTATSSQSSGEGSSQAAKSKKPKWRNVEKYVEAREAVGRGWGGEVVARVG